MSVFVDLGLTVFLTSLNLSFLFHDLIYLVALGLRCRTGFSSVTVRGGYSQVAGHGLLVVAAPLVAEHELWACGFGSWGPQALGHRLNSCGAWAQLLCGMWRLPGSGTEPMPPALAGRFFTTEPPGKP